MRGFRLAGLLFLIALVLFLWKDLYLAPPHSQKKALIYTSHSKAQAVASSLTGGPAGEITVRNSLEETLAELNVTVDTITSDEAFHSKKSLRDYDFVFFDPCTWAKDWYQNMWEPTKVLKGFPPSRIYILDYFGAPNRREMEGKLDVPYKNFLTAYRSPWNNTFLGYFLPASIVKSSAPRKRNQGVIWGKESRNLNRSISLIKHLADRVRLVAVVPPLFEHPNITWIGHMDKSRWQNLLAQSKFLLGTGDPLIGPSAIEAIALGCTFINPTYKEPYLGYMSQHPVPQLLSPERVCNYPHGDELKALECVNQAMKKTFDPFIPQEFTKEEYTRRVKHILNLK